MADAESLGFSLLPVEEGLPTPDEAVASAVASVLADPFAEDVDDEELREPLGVSWEFDFEAGRFTRIGAEPRRVTGLSALYQRMQAAVYTARGAHESVPTTFGIEYPDYPIGELPTQEIISDFGAMLEAALLRVEGVEGIENYEAEFDEASQTIRLTALDVRVTDPAGAVRIADLNLSIVPGDNDG